MTIRAIVIAAAFLAATFSSDASAQTINGCVKDKNGALRIVADPVDCTPRETAISWNQTGPQGPSLRLLDGNGVELGPLANIDIGNGKATFYSAQLDAFVLIRQDQGTIQGQFFSSEVYFAEPNCQGMAYAKNITDNSEFSQRLAVVVLPGGPRFFVLNPPLAESATTRSRSRTTRSDAIASCESEGEAGGEFPRIFVNPYPLTEVTSTLPFSVPIPIPIRAEVAE